MKKKKSYDKMEEEKKEEEVFSVIPDPYESRFRRIMSNKQFVRLESLLTEALSLGIYITFKHFFKKYFHITGHIPDWMKPEKDMCCARYINDIRRFRNINFIINNLREDIIIYRQEMVNISPKPVTEREGFLIIEESHFSSKSLP